MNIERVLTDDARSRRGCGWTLILVGLVLAVGTAGVMVAVHAASIGAMIFIVVLLGVVAFGIRFVLEPNDYVDVDLEARTFVHVRDHQRRDELPLDSLGTLVVSQRLRTVRTKRGARTVTEYAVHPEGRADLDFQIVERPSEARVILERLARRWKLPSRTWGGEVRQPGELDTPLHERLRASADHRDHAPLQPEWNLRVDLLSPGYAIVSSHHDWRPLLSVAITMISLVFVGLIVFRSTLVAGILGASYGARFDRIAEAVFALIALTFVVRGAMLLRETLVPGTLRITPDGVEYRGSRMRFEEIEEVMAAATIELVGDRRLFRLPTTFCPPEAVPWLRDELERMIVEMGNASRMG